MRGIFLVQEDRLVEMTEQPYDSEAVLQDLLARYPRLLSGEQIDSTSPRRWLLVTREAGVPGEEGGSNRWALDHLFLDQDGVPTLIEVKRSSDTRIRREVVGQMLDYAANAVAYWPVEALRAKFETRCERAGMDPMDELAAFLGPESDAESFWQAVATNLRAGRIRMIFVADVIPVELRRVVEFLNTQMSPADALAIEVKQFRAEGLTTLVPTVLGVTAEAQQRKQPSSGSKVAWDKDSFFNDLATKRPVEEHEPVRRIFDWSQANMSRVTYGAGRTVASFIPVFEHAGIAYYPFAVYSSGTVEIGFQRIRDRPPFESEDTRLALLAQFNELEGVSIPPDAITRRPNVPFSVLAIGDNLDRFLAIFEWLKREVLAAQSPAV